MCCNLSDGLMKMLEKCSRGFNLSKKVQIYEMFYKKVLIYQLMCHASTCTIDYNDADMVGVEGYASMETNWWLSSILIRVDESRAWI